MRRLALTACIAAALPLATLAEDKAASAAERCPATLPGPVAARQHAIIAAGRAHDYPALLRQVTVPSRFSATFGDPGDPGDAWQEMRKQGVDLAGIMAAIFAMPCSVARVEGKVLYTWPTAADFDWSALNADERAALQKLYGSKIDSYWIEGREKGYYVGWRGIIETDGTWTVFVAGD